MTAEDEDRSEIAADMTVGDVNTTDSSTVDSSTVDSSTTDSATIDSGTADTVSTDLNGTVETDPDGVGRAAPTAPDFGDLSLLQRVFVAAVQNPMRGVVMLILFAFAFSFYVAFWMAFPRVAAFFSVLAVAFILLLAVGYLLVRRVR